MTPELDRRKFLKLAGVTAVLAACGGAPSTASSSPSTAASSSSPTGAATAKPTGRISIYSALNESTNNELFKAFTTATGVQVDVLPLAAAGDLQTRITRDEDKAMAFMKSLHANIAQYVATSPGALLLIDQGQFVGCPNWSHDILTEKTKGNPIDLSVPSDTGFEVGAVSIVKGTKNLPAAQAFVDWVLTPEAGALNVKLSNRGSTLPGVAAAPGSPTLDQVKLVAYDRQWATDNKTRIQQLWQKTVGIS